MLDDQQLFRDLKFYTKVGFERFAAMAQAVRDVDRKGIAGDIVECGVWRAGHIILARKLSPSRVCWLYDTFSGMTEPSEIDVRPDGETASSAIARYNTKKKRQQVWCLATLEEVKDNLEKTGTFDEQYLRFVVGDVLETLQKPISLPERIAVLHLDTDWYASTRAELEILYPRLQPGGTLIVDDYGHWMGAKKAVDEYFAGMPAQLEVIDYSARRVVKPC